MKTLSLLGPFISKVKTDDIFNFPSTKYFGKFLLFLKMLHIRVNTCYNYGPSNLLFHFFRYRLGHLNNRQIEIVENSTIFFFFWILTPKLTPTTKWRPVKSFAKLNGNHILMANFSKLRKYQTIGLIELHNLRRGQLANRMFKLWKRCVCNYRAVKYTTFEILTF